MKKTLYRHIIPSKAEEEAGITAAPELVEIRDVYPYETSDPSHPWKIIHIVEPRDMERGFILIPNQKVMDHIFRFWTLEMSQKAHNGDEIRVVSWDLTESNNPVLHNNEHSYIRKSSNEHYAIGWMSWARNRCPSPGATIGMYWDKDSSSLCFKVLN